MFIVMLKLELNAKICRTGSGMPVVMQIVIMYVTGNAIEVFLLRQDLLEKLDFNLQNNLENSSQHLSDVDKSDHKCKVATYCKG